MNLVDFPALLLILVKFALLDRVEKGDAFIHFAKHTHAWTSLSGVLARIPLPTTLNRVDGAFYAGVYFSGMYGLTSVFDGVHENESVSAFVDFSLGIAQISAHTWLVALVYIDRLTRRVPSIVLNTNNVYRLLSSALMVATKYQEENNVSVSVFADLARTTASDMTWLERVLLEALDYRLFISDDDLEIAQLGLVCSAMHARPGGSLGQTLHNRGVHIVKGAARLVELWREFYHACNVSSGSLAQWRGHSAFALIHGNLLDSNRVDDAIRALASALPPLEVGNGVKMGSLFANTSYSMQVYAPIPVSNPCMSSTIWGPQSCHDARLKMLSLQCEKGLYLSAQAAPDDPGLDWAKIVRDLCGEEVHVFAMGHGSGERFIGGSKRFVGLPFPSGSVLGNIW